jgi:Holliday junction DNA helicase RuvB
MRIVGSELAQGDEEKSLRPDKLEQYIGQDKIKDNLEVFIEASKRRDESLDHILLFGSAGLGKTTLANIISNEMEANLKIISAPSLEKSGDLAAILTNLNERDILFIDEVHRLSTAIEEILYTAMEDFRLDIIVGSGPAANTIKIDLPKFTLIAATTRAGMLSQPLRDRFGIQFRLEFYTTNELSVIINLASKKLNRSCDESSAYEIAKRSRGTPRIALRLLRRVRDFADIKNNKHIDIDITKFSLERLGVNEIGFDELDIRFLELLMEAKKPIGLSTIASSISEDEGTIEYVIEPYLMANGYIQRSSKGRIATQKTYELLKLGKNRQLI